ncbi:hypothetical protein B0H63DRAFT_527349 [Podospora didyma]|uniref:Uncharacterized protein n=1 Tax=Podospora didyma TaxID=330526 RepID=A0AAE0KAV1_9PEZI|nr:hypothetical protein B0H63DRAFT_527349 [Podospora didyma]
MDNPLNTTVSRAGSGGGSDLISSWTSPGSPAANNAQKRGGQKPRSKGGKPGLLTKMHKMTDWLSTSEPSAQALKQHKKKTFEKAGISLDDTQAGAKLHAPMGDIPADAIKPTTGPDPEDVAKKRMAERRKRKQSESGGPTARASMTSSQSSSGFSSFSSRKGSVSSPVSDLPFDGWNR